MTHIIAAQLENPVQQPRLIGVIGLLTGFMLIAYVVVYSFTAFRPGVGGE